MSLEEGQGDDEEVLESFSSRLSDELAGSGGGSTSGDQVTEVSVCATAKEIAGGWATGPWTPHARETERKKGGEERLWAHSMTMTV